MSFAGRPAALGVVTKSHPPEANPPYKLANTPRIPKMLNDLKTDDPVIAV
jgi:hypothetical protein